MIINQIIEGITVAIAEEFGDDFNIYVEQIEQELEEPCFFVHLVTGNHELFLGKRYQGVHHFDIQYFPSSDSIQRECNDVAERLSGCLEYIILYDDATKQNEAKPIRGGQMSYNLIDGVLHFNIYYNGFILKKEEQTEMESLLQSTTARDD